MNTPHIKPRAMFFDWDGTIVDSSPFLFSLHMKICEELNHPIFDHKAWADVFGKPRPIIFGTLYGDRADMAERAFDALLAAEHLNHINIIEGVEDLFKTLQAKNITVGVVSNKPAAFLRAEVAHLGWDHYFSAVIGRGDTPESKPAAAPLRKAISDSGLDIKEGAHAIWMIGDTENDVQCAHNADCTPVLIMEHANDHIKSSDQYDSTPAFDTIRSFKAYCDRL